MPLPPTAFGQKDIDFLNVLFDSILLAQMEY